MKLALAWILALVVAVAAASSCTIRHKSSNYECEVTPDCTDGRTCVDGYCVTGGTNPDARTDGPVVDGPRDSGPDTPMCPAQCTTCGENMKCVIDCSIDSCNDEIVCPPGWNCTIGCSTTNSCTQGIDCSDAASCTIACSGNQSCRDLQCGGGQCKVACTGRQSCIDMDCSDACACDVTCTGTGQNAPSCSNTQCPDFQCAQFGGRCTSAVPGCNTCQ